MYQIVGELQDSEEPATLPDFENMSKKELRELIARLRLVKPKRRKGYKPEITEHQRLQLDAELRSRASTPVKRKLIYFFVAAACHLWPGCACSTGTSAYKRMTNGDSVTDSSEKFHIY